MSNVFRAAFIILGCIYLKLISCHQVTVASLVVLELLTVLHSQTGFSGDPWFVISHVFYLFIFLIGFILFLSQIQESITNPYNAKYLGVIQEIVQSKSKNGFVVLQGRDFQYMNGEISEMMTDN